MQFTNFPWPSTFQVLQFSLHCLIQIWTYPPPDMHTDRLYFRCHGMSIASITTRTIDHAAMKQLDDICHNTLCATIMHLNFEAGGYWSADL